MKKLLLLLLMVSGYHMNHAQTVGTFDGMENPCPLIPIPQCFLTYHLHFSIIPLRQIKMIPCKY
jgi:hypothetical protein